MERDSSRTLIHAWFSVPNYMRLGVMGSILKRRSIWPIIQKADFKQISDTTNDTSGL